MIRSFACAAALLVTAFNAWADPLPTETHKVLPSALAVEAAQAAVAACKAQGYTVTATVVDRTGTPKAVVVGDGARDLTLLVTQRKAYTSALWGVSTADYTKRVTTPGAFNPGLYDPQLTTGPGGLPIKAGNETIGGIAAAGAPGGDKDEACAKAGIDKISAELQ